MGSRADSCLAASNQSIGCQRQKDLGGQPHAADEKVGSPAADSVLWSVHVSVRQRPVSTVVWTQPRQLVIEWPFPHAQRSHGKWHSVSKSFPGIWFSMAESRGCTGWIKTGHVCIGGRIMKQIETWYCDLAYFLAKYLHIHRQRHY